MLALFYTLYFARAFFLPIALAVLLDFLLSPLIRAMKRIGVPEPLSAALVVISLLAITAGAGYGLAGPAKDWAGKLPASMRETEARLQKLRGPVEQVSKTAADRWRDRESRSLKVSAFLFSWLLLNMLCSIWPLNA